MSLDSESDKSQLGEATERIGQGTPELRETRKENEPLDEEEKKDREELSNVEKELDAEIEKMKAELEASPSMKDTMDQLHEYNEIKDATQLVLGAIANMHRVTIARLHEEYNLPLGEE